MKAYTNKLKNVPTEVIEKMLENQVAQGNKKDPTVFDNCIAADKNQGGFTWEYSTEGHDFWANILSGLNHLNPSSYDDFYLRYPEKTEAVKTETVEFTGILKDVPKDVLGKLLENVIAQGNSDLKAIDEDSFAGRSSGGFTWAETEEGSDFWGKVIQSKNYSDFYKRFPEFTPETEAETKTEYEGELKGFPKEVVDKMLEHQVAQKQPKDVTIFERYAIAGSDTQFGFNWSDTKEGHDFWSRVIKRREFELFFERYPKETEAKTELDEEDSILKAIQFLMDHEDDEEVLKEDVIKSVIRTITGRPNTTSDIEDVPEEIVKAMLRNQKAQTGKEDISKLEFSRFGGFLWTETEEGNWFWNQVIGLGNYDLYFAAYPKKK